MRDGTENYRAAVDEDAALDRALASLVHFSPAPGFEGRVMARVVTPAPVWIQKLGCRWRSLAESGRLSWLLGGLAAAFAVSVSAAVGTVALNAEAVRQSLNGLFGEVGLPIWRATLGVATRVVQDVYTLVDSVTLPGPVWAALGVGCSLTLVLNVLILRRLMQPAGARAVKLNAPH
jgi:hypothetical protein